MQVEPHASVHTKPHGPGRNRATAAVGLCCKTVGVFALSLLMLALQPAFAGNGREGAFQPPPAVRAQLDQIGWTQQALQPFWARRITGYLTTRDGVKLRYSVLLPKGEGRFPVIINYSGYNPGEIGGLAYRHGTTAMSANLDRTLIEHGYAVMGVNARGTGCSQGEFDFLGPKYGEDGYDAVEFAASQAWSNGAVGMANWSWAGMSQIATASDRPPHLKAIAPGMVLGDPRLDSWYPGGVPAPAFIAGWRGFLHDTWASFRYDALSSHDQACLAQLDRNLAYEEAHSITHMVFEHPLRDAWIEQRDLRNRTHLIDVPVLSMETFQDEAVTSREGYYQETLNPNQVWMIQSNGGHDLYESLSFRPVLVAFFDHFLKGENNGFEKRPHLQVWMNTTSSAMGNIESHDEVENARPGWVLTEPAIDPQVKPLSFVLAAKGKMDIDGTPGGEPDAYQYPAPGPVVGAFDKENNWGPLPANWKKGSVAYTSAPLGNNIFAYGPASADLWISSSQADTDLQVTLTEVRPDGQERFIQRSVLRVSDRAVDPKMSTPTHPVLVDMPQSIEPLDPDVPVLARVELNKFAYVFRKGSRLRIWIDTPSQYGGNGFSYFSLQETDKVWHDPAHPSKLVIGTLPETAIKGAEAPCGTLLREPCRPDPLSQ